MGLTKLPVAVTGGDVNPADSPPLRQITFTNGRR